MNPALLQKQLKENANDLQDFYKDLQSWGEEMKRKESSLMENSSKKVKVPVNKSQSQRKTEQNKHASKIGSTDYNKWEKFDADLECERLEDDFKDDSELTDEFEENARDEALVHKEDGNSYVKKKEWDKAIECYTKAINCYSFDPIYYANRALCYLKKNNFIAAEEDCNTSLRLDHTYVKALQRRAAAREALGKLTLAINDLELVLVHEPNNKESKVVWDRIKKKLEKSSSSKSSEENRPVSKFAASRNQVPSSKPSIETNASLEKATSESNKATSTAFSWPGESDVINVKPINKPPHLRSKKPLRRIEIKEVNSLSDVKSKGLTNEAVKKHVVEKHNKKQVLIMPETVAGSGEPAEKISAFKRNREKSSNAKKEIFNNKSWPEVNSDKTTIKCDDLEVCERKLEYDIREKDIKNTENIITKMDSQITVKALDSNKEELPVPKTSVQFYKAWKSLASINDKYKYLKLISPEKLPELFGESLDSKIFSEILEILVSTFIEKGDNIYGILFELTRVKRFSALTLFMEPKDKKCLWKLITFLREKGNHSADQVDNLISEYGL
ncbi:hypothetical protein ABEB36_002589 [Hypothenemus hampei]|uniref:RNA polymerase II-associated protein 3 n=1 Tax=Hypothenemus hampei TaxID=57062 RepID=A0ABD1F6A2_HYPHA